jgi:hypothetical protein
MSIVERFRRAARAALTGWIGGFLLVAPLQLLEAVRNAGWSTAKATPGLFAGLLALSLLLWMALSLVVAVYCCCAFLFVITWIIAPERIRAHRWKWNLSCAAFGVVLIASRSHLWTAFNHDGVGFSNFWVWSFYAAAYCGVTAEAYYRRIGEALQQ